MEYNSGSCQVNNVLTIKIAVEFILLILLKKPDYTKSNMVNIFILVLNELRYCIFCWKEPFKSYFSAYLISRLTHMTEQLFFHFLACGRYPCAMDGRSAAKCMLTTSHQLLASLCFVQREAFFDSFRCLGFDSQVSRAHKASVHSSQVNCISWELGTQVRCWQRHLTGDRQVT